MDDADDRAFREIIGELGPILVTDDMGVWDFFHGLVQSWDSLNMRDELERAVEENEWFAEFVRDPLAWCIKVANEWEQNERLPEYLRDWVRDHIGSVVDFMIAHDMRVLRLWVNVPGDDWLYMLWDSDKGGANLAD